ncbi:MAG: hypothetical protein R3F19_19985 [Verrucomicrobiales bacterium]
MKRKRPFSLLPSLGALTLLGALSTGGYAGPVDDFVADFEKAYQNKEDIAAEARGAALEQLKSAPSAQMVSTALRRLYPDLDTAILEADAGKSIEKLIALTETGDPFLSAEAHYAIGRRLFADQKHEQALPLFQKVANELASHSMRAGESTYYLGVCQEQMLLKKDALGTFETMIAFFGDEVSNRLRDDAVTRIAQLQQDVDGSLGDVANHMGFSERKLALTDTGERTIEVQDHIVAMLDGLIEQAENGPPCDGSCAGQGSGNSPGQGSGSGMGNSNGEQGNGQAQAPPTAAKRILGAARSGWDDMREKARDTEALAGKDADFPARYKKLLKQYFEDLGNEDAASEE